MSQPIPIIDLFVGPGGLAEGFSAVTDIRPGGLRKAERPVAAIRGCYNAA